MLRENRLLTSIGEIEVVQAQPSDCESVLAILEDASQWLLSRGINQWPPGRFPRHIITNTIELGQVYLAKYGEEAIGTFTLQWSDKVVWGEVSDDAGYVHRLAIRRAYSGKGIGLKLLRWAEQMVARAGKQYLRLDCWSENAALCQYYERAGFVCRGRVETKMWKATLYEKKVQKNTLNP